MKKYLYIFFIGIVFIHSDTNAQTDQGFSSFNTAKKHGIVYDGPAPDFFQGALLGNGGMGVVVCTRPDAIVLRFGHNDVWDIRIAENHRKEVGTFNEVFQKISQIPDTLSSLNEDAWYLKYSRTCVDNYLKPYPRPFPCGSVILGFDPRKIEMIGYKLDISNGVCEVKMLSADKKEIYLSIFTDMEKDVLWMELLNSDGSPHRNIFSRLRVMPDPSTPKEFPEYLDEEDLTNRTIAFRQIMPYQEPDKYDPEMGNPKDKAFRLMATVNTPLVKGSRINWDGIKETMGSLEAGFGPEESFVASVSIHRGLDSSVSRSLPVIVRPTLQEFTKSLQRNTVIWEKYWNKSGVRLSDVFLEEIWYRNLYFLNCAAREGITCPGLFANWSYNDIGTAWHGDYHLNYNIEQPFWVTFSSNHLEKNLPYVGLIGSLMAVSGNWAKEYYGLPGVYFPHTAYPVDMTMNPYPVPTWGWQVSETPWAVQGLWWHYLYSGDREFLKNKAYIPIKEAVKFLVAYLRRPDAHGGERWKDDKYHIFPTVPPELYGLQPGFKYNYDCAVDLTLTKFIFNAFLKATTVLGTGEIEKDLISGVKDVLGHFPEYPTAWSKEYGQVLVSVPGESDQVVYNVPNALFTVFPGEDYGLHSDPRTFSLLRNTFRNRQNEGGNDLVFKNLQAARIGMLDLEQFKRQVKYSLLADGTATDMVMQTHGRYNDLTSFDFMSKMGIWFENFSLPVVINECLIQSYDSSIRLFPNWPQKKDATFYNLRAVGAFLISADLKGGKLKKIKILSEKGNPLRIISPWGKAGYVINNRGRKKIGQDVLDMKTSPGEYITLLPD